MTDNSSRYRELLEYTYGPAYYHMRWIMPQEAQISEIMRNQVLAALGDRIERFYKGNKLVYRSLSPGMPPLR